MATIVEKHVRITDNYEGGPNLAYTGRIIHFGGNFKSITYEWKLKFENLLTKLIWQGSRCSF